MKFKLLTLVSLISLSNVVFAATDYVYERSDGLYRSTHDDITTVGRREPIPSREYTDMVREEKPITYTGKMEALKEARVKHDIKPRSFINSQGEIIN